MCVQNWQTKKESWGQGRNKTWKGKRRKNGNEKRSIDEECEVKEWEKWKHKKERREKAKKKMVGVDINGSVWLAGKNAGRHRMKGQEVEWKSIGIF